MIELQKYENGTLYRTANGFLYTDDVLTIKGKTVNEVVSKLRAAADTLEDKPKKSKKK